MAEDKIVEYIAYLILGFICFYMGRAVYRVYKKLKGRW
jgi:hypothetical protein